MGYCILRLLRSTMAERLTDDVWLLDIGLFPPVASNAYLVDDGEVTLIDTGLMWNRPTLRSELRDAGYEPAALDRVLLTHYDLDHTGGLGRLAQPLPPVYIGEEDARMLADEWTPPWFHHKGLFHRVARRLFPLPDGTEVRRVRDGDRIGSFTAYHTPGHNPGHTAYVHDGGVAFVGDLVWEEDGELSPMFWFDSYDMHQLRESIRVLAERIEFEFVCMGHGDPLAAPEALDALVGRLDDRPEPITA
jgi:glyoxylase-like metal-dependent hydrolase (beta-lactamase superfamily II)